MISREEKEATIRNLALEVYKMLLDEGLIVEREYNRAIKLETRAKQTTNELLWFNIHIQQEKYYKIKHYGVQ